PPPTATASPVAGFNSSPSSSSSTSSAAAASHTDARLEYTPERRAKPATILRACVTVPL
ncbi:hypothetical protein Sste5344_004596, partial [Sporothrix stenoceras]